MKSYTSCDFHHCNKRKKEKNISNHKLGFRDPTLRTRMLHKGLTHACGYKTGRIYRYWGGGVREEMRNRQRLQKLTLDVTLPFT